MWEIEYTDEFGDWFASLDHQDQDAIIAAVEVLERDGPGLGRPLVDTVRESSYAHMKELRPPAGAIRILFAFDPRRIGILLIGGDKRDRWNEWYQEMIPHADRLYGEHLEILRSEGLLDDQD
jgi:hypothetical protein